MDAVLPIVLDVIAHQSAQMVFVQRDDVVENLTAAASHPAFGDTVLPRRVNACPFGFQTRRSQDGGHFRVEYRIPVEDHIPVWPRMASYLVTPRVTIRRSRAVAELPIRRWDAGSH